REQVTRITEVTKVSDEDDVIWVTMDKVAGSSEPQWVQEEEESVGWKRKRMEQDKDKLQEED
ncbi:hypothetical protein ABG768_022169, partial [Culter alburnus]